MAFPIVAKQFAGAILRHKEVETAVVIEVAEYRADLAGDKGDAGIFGHLKTSRRIHDQQAVSSAVEEIRPTVVIDVGDGKGIALDFTADAVRSQADFSGHIFEHPTHNLRLWHLGGKIKRPLAVSLTNLEKQGILAFFQLEN